MFTFNSSLSRGHAAVRGLLAIVLGAVCVIWPGITIGVVVALFAIYCFADAITQVVGLIWSSDSVGQRVLMIVLALIDVIAAVIAISYPGITAGVLVIIVGIWAIFGGIWAVTASILELAATWGSSGWGSGWFAIGGLLSVTAGVLLVGWPGRGAYSLALVFGIYLLAYGLTLLLGALMTRGDEAVGETFA
jgi:uncharacterized membrane protein HdeD (DUF308 family)